MARAAEPIDADRAHGASVAADSPADAGLLGLAVVALVAAFAGVFWSLDGLPYQDVPNHLARAVAIADLLFDGGRRFGATFTFDWQFVPYVLGDLCHAATLAWLPPDAAARVWVIVAFASLPAATWLLLREWDAPPATRVAAAAFAVFLAADWFLRLGFLNFKYGLALALLATVAWERATGAPTPGRVLAFAGLAVAGYLMHLASLVFLVAIVGTLSAVRVLREPRHLVRYAAFGVPLLAFLGWHVLFQGSAEVGAAVQPPVHKKLLRIGGALAPTREPADVAIALAFIALVAVPLGRHAWRTRVRGWPVRAVEAFALAVAFVAVYLVLPEMKGDVWGVDIRALPFIWLFAAIAALLVVPPAHVRALGWAAVAIGLLHLGALGATLAQDDAAMREYRDVARAVPDGARVLTVVTRPRRGVVSPTAHAGSFATIYARAVVPYTFTGDLDAPMPYFNFRRRPPPFPWQWWYLHEEPPVPAPRLLTGYDYLLIQRPVDWRRVPVEVEVVRANREVVLARVRAPVASERVR